MNPRKTKDIKATLSSKGFVPEERDHSYYFLHVDGQKSSIRTKISHVNKEYGSNLLSLVARQLHLSNAELDNFLDCPLRHTDYITILKEKKKLKP